MQQEQDSKTARQQDSKTARQGTSSRFESEVDSIERVARNVARRLVSGSDVDDIVQDTLVEIMSAKATVKSILAFAAAVARNLCLRHHASCFRRRTMAGVDVDALPSPDRSSPDVRAWLRDVALPILGRHVGPKGSRSGRVTPREMRVATALANGSSNVRDLADRLGTRPYCVREALRSLGERIHALDVPAPPLWG